VPIGYLAASLAVLGLGVGLGSSAATTAAIESAPRGQAGVAAGTNSMMRYFGSIVGVGVLAGTLGDGSGAPEITTFRTLFAILAVLAGLALLAAALIHRFPPAAVFEAHEAPVLDLAESRAPTRATPDLP
jgi:MFS family permease